MSSDRLIVVGAGYVGLVAGTCFAKAGFEVGIVEINPEKLKSLKNGECPFYEPSLSELMQEGIQAERLKFYSNQEDALKEMNPDFIFCAVGTPEKPDGSANLDYVEAALSETLKHAKKACYFILKSTVPVGTGKRLQEIANKNSQQKISIVNNPEFLREGTAVSDFMRPERVVLGGDKEGVEAVAKLYQSFLLNNRPLIRTDSTSAELGKLAANLMLASRISLINQVARLADATQANIREIEKILQSDSRIGSKYLYSGLGFGGSCFPKDIQNFIKVCSDNDVDASLAKSVDSYNDSQKLFFSPHIQKDFPETQKTTICVLGLAFKPETDDIRESPALVIVNDLVKKGYQVKVYDPKALNHFKAETSHLKNIHYCSKLSDCLKDSQALILVTEWQEFQRLTPEKLKTQFSGTHIYDGKNVLNPAQFKSAGYKYKGVGQT